MGADKVTCCLLGDGYGFSFQYDYAEPSNPLDEATILEAARETGAIVTAENNVIFGGLGSAVAEIRVENHPIPMARIGVKDTYAESGPYLEVIDKYGLTARHIVAAVEGVLKRKSGQV